MSRAAYPAFAVLVLLLLAACSIGIAAPTLSLAPTPTLTLTPMPTSTPALRAISGQWAIVSDAPISLLWFRVNPEGTAITEFGGLGRRAGSRRGRVIYIPDSDSRDTWSMRDGGFTITIPFAGGKLVISGAFDETGTHATGTWGKGPAAGSYLGIWEAFPFGMIPTQETGRDSETRKAEEELTEHLFEHARATWVLREESWDPETLCPVEPVIEERGSVPSSPTQYRLAFALAFVGSTEATVHFHRSQRGCGYVTGSCYRIKYVKRAGMWEPIPRTRIEGDQYSLEAFGCPPTPTPAE